MKFLVFGNNLSGYVPASLTKCKMLELLLLSSKASDPTTKSNPGGRSARALLIGAGWNTLSDTARPRADMKCTQATMNAIIKALPNYDPKNFVLPEIV